MDLDRDRAEESDSPDRADHELFPISIPPNAELEAKFNLHWPEQLDGRIAAAPDPLVLHYARLNWNEQPARAVSFFNRQLKGAQYHALDNGCWLDCVTRPTPGKLRSIDVRIKRSHPDADEVAASNRNEPAELTVEILCLEINDFAPSSRSAP